MDIRIRLRRDLRQAVIERLQQAYQSGQVRLVRRIHALLFVIEGKAIDEVATMLNLGGTDGARLRERLSVARCREFGVSETSGATAEADQDATKGVGGADQSWARGGGLHDSVLECGADPGLGAAHLWS